MRSKIEKDRNRKKIEKSIIEKLKKIEIEKRISIFFFSINKFLYQKLFKRTLNMNAGFSKKKFYIAAITIPTLHYKCF